MSKRAAHIASGIRHLGRKDIEVKSGYVRAVDEAAATMDIMLYDGELELDGVLLRGSDQGADGVVVVPELDSDVIVASVDGPGEWALIRTSSVKKVLVEIGSTTLQIDQEGVTINGGDNAGLVIDQKLQENLDAIKDYLAALKTAIETGLTAVGVGAAANGGTGKSAFSAAMASQQLRFGDMKNNKVKH